MDDISTVFEKDNYKLIYKSYISSGLLGLATLYTCIIMTPEVAVPGVNVNL